MRFYLLLLLSILTPASVFATTIVNVGGAYNRTARDYKSPRFSLIHISGHHTVFTNYKQDINLHNKHKNLYSSGLFYSYNDSEVLAGLYIDSSSNHLFGSAGVTNAFIFGGYNILNESSRMSTKSLKSGGKVNQPTADQEGKPKFYLGAFITNIPMYGSFMLPFISFEYENDEFEINLGIPTNSIKWHPNETHEVELSVMGYNMMAKYKYSFSNLTSAAVSFSQEVERYILLNDARKTFDADKKALWYLRNWFKLNLKHNFNYYVGVEFTYGYQLSGYHSYSRYLNISRKDKLPHNNEFALELSLMF